MNESLLTGWFCIFGPLIAETDDNAAMFVWGESNNQLAQNKWVFMFSYLDLKKKKTQ